MNELKLNPQFKQRGVLDLRFLIISGGTLIFILMVAYFFYALQPVGLAASESPIKFKISKGDGFKEIGAALSQQKLVKSIGVFKMYSLITGKAQKFQPGVYDLSASMTVPEIVSILTSSKGNDIAVVIPEGSSFKDIDAILASAQVIQKNSLVDFPFKKLATQYSFLNGVLGLEGFLFPDTYRFEADSDVESIVKKLLDNFETKAWPMLSQEKNWYNSLILASLLEREVPDFNDRQIVAGILLKRLQAKVPLQVDATLSYAKCGGEFRDCSTLLVAKSDLTITSSYNTYQRLGLTPTPISNPGQAAIKAALNPKSSPYWYYLSAKDTKETVFSKTLEEHNDNRFKYL